MGLPGHATRPYAVYDGGGELLGTFASWPVAHEWSHVAAGMPAAVLPIELDDRAARTTQRITTDGCERIHWVPAGTVPGCPLPRPRRTGPTTPARVT